MVFSVSYSRCIEITKAVLSAGAMTRIPLHHLITELNTVYEMYTVRAITGLDHINLTDVNVIAQSSYSGHRLDQFHDS